MPLNYPDGSPAIGADGTAITGGKFLDMYRNPESRQHTEDTLTGFLSTDSGSPTYAEDRAYIAMMLQGFFGEPRFNADVS